MQEISKMVESFLVEAPHLRDCDRKLVASIWKYEVVHFLQLDYDKMSADDLMSVFSEGFLANPTSVRRVRAKLQEENVALRGRLWNHRHKNAKDVAQQIINWNEQ